MKKILPFLIISMSAAGMQHSERLPQPYTDAKGYTYLNEDTAHKVKRRIAVLAYGSLVRQPENKENQVRIETTEFQPSSIILPISLMRESKKGMSDRKITAIVNPNGQLKKVWVAPSKFQFLHNARNNLAGREGASFLGQSTGYSLKHIPYMIKIDRNQRLDSNEALIPGANGWAIRLNDDEARSKPLNDEMAQQIAQWADTNNYTAVIWTDYPANLKSQAEVIQRLLADETMLRNTQEYVRNLAEGPQTDFERAIVVGKQALQNYYAALTQAHL